MPAAADQFVIQRAERTQTRLRIALQGSSGGGKTATSLLLAKGMVEELGRRGQLPSHLDCHIGLLDTERDSAKLFSHLVPFDTVVLTPPYTVDRYLGALAALERVGYPVIIVDQITHEWHGEGGILAWVREIQSQGGNEFTAWKKPSEAHERFIDRLLATPAHLIATMRSKTEWVLEEKVGRDGKTKKVPTRIGMAARQREGTEYEFTTVLDLSAGTNQARCLKDRTELFEIGGVVPRDPAYLPHERSLGIGATYGAKLIEWVHTAEKPEPVSFDPTPAERVEATCDAGIRACDRAPNVPDLIVAFDGAQRALRALAREAGSEAVVPALARLVAAKDRAKAAFGALGGLAPVADPDSMVSPDEVLVLEQLLSDGSVPSDAFRTIFQIGRLAQLPAARWDEAVGWIVRMASAAGRRLDVPARPRPADHEPSLPEQMEAKLRAIGNGRGGLFAEETEPPAGHPASRFDDMSDDLPWSP